MTTGRDIPRLPPLPDDERSEVSERTEVTAPPVEPASEPSPARAETRDRPRRRPRAEKESRRLWSAGHALVVSVLAICFGLLLDAPGIHKSAFNQPAGWKRDVATTFTTPLADVSHALLLDRPRIAVHALIGRDGIDDIDTEIAIPAAPPKTGTPKPKPTPKPATPATPHKPAFTPKHKLDIWIAGDSLVVTPGYAILRAASASPVMASRGGVDGRVATGLSRPDVFNWFQEIRDRMKTLKPNVVVLAFGGNDDKAYMTGLPDGISIDDFGDASWRREYRRRVSAVFETIARAGGHVFWIGLPQTRDADQTRRFDVINAAAAAEARERPNTVTYVDTYTLFAGPDGGYAEYLPNAKGSMSKVRAGDGVHFEPAGGDMIARLVVKTLNKTYDLTSWRKKPSA